MPGRAPSSGFHPLLSELCRYRGCRLHRSTSRSRSRRPPGVTCASFFKKKREAASAAHGGTTHTHTHRTACSTSTLLIARVGATRGTLGVWVVLSQRHHSTAATTTTPAAQQNFREGCVTGGRHTWSKNNSCSDDARLPGSHDHGVAWVR